MSRFEACLSFAVFRKLAPTHHARPPRAPFVAAYDLAFVKEVSVREKTVPIRGWNA